MSNLLVAEVAHPQHRAKISAIGNCMYGVGSTWCSWIALANIKVLNDWSWRSLTIMQCIPSVLILAAIYWVPESPRWLIAHERYEAAENSKSLLVDSSHSFQATACFERLNQIWFWLTDAVPVLAHYHGKGDKENSTVAFEYREIKQTLALEFQHKKSTSYLDFVKTPGNRYRIVLLFSLAMFSQYSGSNLFSNYANIIYQNAGINGQQPKLLVSTSPQHSHTDTDCFPAERRPDDVVPRCFRDLLLIHRPLRAKAALPGFDSGHGPNIHGVDDHQFAV